MLVPAALRLPACFLWGAAGLILISHGLEEASRLLEMPPVMRTGYAAWIAVMLAAISLALASSAETPGTWYLAGLSSGFALCTLVSMWLIAIGARRMASEDELGVSAEMISDHVTEALRRRGDSRR